MMHFLFVKNGLPGSRLIRWGTGEDCSHVAILFDAGGMVFHSYLTGIKKETKSRFMSKYRVVYEVSFPFTSPDDDERAYELMMDSVPVKNSYDYGALTYFTYRAALNKLFGIDYPRLNAWQDDEGFLCTELTYLGAEVYKQVMGESILPVGFDLAMVTPGRLRLMMEAKRSELMERLTILGIEDKAIFLTTGVQRAI